MILVMFIITIAMLVVFENSSFLFHIIVVRTTQLPLPNVMIVIMFSIMIIMLMY